MLHDIKCNSIIDLHNKAPNPEEEDDLHGTNHSSTSLLALKKIITLHSPN